MTADSTTYDRQGHNVHLTSDRSANSARPLAGYPLDARPDSAWPGLGGSGQIWLQPEQVEQVAAWLEERARGTRSLPGWLAEATSVGFGPSSWHEAKNLEEASLLVSGAVKEHLQRLLANLDDAAKVLLAATGEYRAAEQANTRTVQSANTALGDSAGGSAPTRPTQVY
jgi:hypothetical protein